jgi:hypothetical protein
MFSQIGAHWLAMDYPHAASLFVPNVNRRSQASYHRELLIISIFNCCYASKPLHPNDDH